MVKFATPAAVVRIFIGRIVLCALFVVPIVLLVHCRVVREFTQLSGHSARLRLGDA